jgi:hypothetical protein
MPGLRFVPLLLLVPTLAGAQVGHPPERSPYRDITLGSSLTPQAVLVRGAGGRLGVVPHNGRLFGTRAEILTNRAVSLGLEVSYGTAERMIVQPDSSFSGPEPVTMGMFGGNIVLNLAGGKTWRGLAPYAGGGAGLAVASALAADTSGFRYGARFYFAPTVGVRAFITRDVYLRLEARSLFTRMTYPTALVGRVLGGGSPREWVTTGLYTAGLGVPFPRLF